MSLPSLRLLRLSVLAAVLFLVLVLVLVLALGLALLLALAPATARAAGRSLRRGQVVGERVGDLLDRPEPLARGVDQLVGARRVPLGGGEQRGADLARLLERRVDELRGVLLVPVAARVGERAEETLGLRELGAGAPVLNLARRLGEPPGPADEDLLGRVHLAVAQRAEQGAHALNAVLLPGRRLGHERDQVVEAGPVDDHRDAIGERGQAQAPVRVLGGAGVQELLEGAAVRLALGELLDELDPLVEAHVAPGDRGPVELLVVVEVARVGPLPFARDHGEPALHVRGHRHEPRRRRQFPAGPALDTASRRRGDPRALAVEVGVQQAVQRDDALVVRRALGREVDHHARLLARVHAHDPADPLLVDASRGGRGKVHADRRAWRVPAFSEQHRVDEHVDLAALVGGKGLGELHGRRAAAHGLGLEPRGPEFLRQVVRVLDAGRVDDPRRVLEAVAVEACRRLVESRVVEHGSERALLEVAADDRHRGDRGGRRHAQAAQWRDQPAAGGVSQRQLVDRGREDVGDLLGDQLLGRSHSDVERIREAADRLARLLAERRVRLVGDHEVVRLGVEVLPVAREPGVGLDGDRVRALRLLPLENRVLEAVAVALGRQLAIELRDEESAVGEDQDAEGAGGLDEAGGGDRLPGGGWVAEAEAPACAGVLAVVLQRQLELVARLLEVDAEILLFVFLGLRPDFGSPVAVQLRLDLGGGDQLGEHPRQRVDLMAAELSTRGEPGGPLAEHALEPEHQRVADLPVV